ncbi:MAG: hypothetical protein ACI9F9_001448, partial [Candidatus Paceibacteria bacterium]
MKHRQFIHVLFGFGLLLGGACLATPQVQPLTSSLQSAPVNMRDQLARYFTDRNALQSFYSLQRSPIRTDRLEALDNLWAKALDELDYEALDTAGQIDFHLLQSGIEFQRAKREQLRKEMSAAEQELPFRTLIFELELTRWQVGECAPEDAARDLSRIATMAQ